MKIDKDFVVKFGEHTFTATEACRIANEKMLREEYATRRCKCQCIPYFHNEDMEPKAPDEVVKQAVQEAIKECGKDLSRKAKIFWW